MRDHSPAYMHSTRHAGHRRLEPGKVFPRQPHTAHHLNLLPRLSFLARHLHCHALTAHTESYIAYKAGTAPSRSCSLTAWGTAAPGPTRPHRLLMASSLSKVDLTNGVSRVRLSMSPVCLIASACSHTPWAALRTRCRRCSGSSCTLECSCACCADDARAPAACWNAASASRALPHLCRVRMDHGCSTGVGQPRPQGSVCQARCAARGQLPAARLASSTSAGTDAAGRLSRLLRPERLACKAAQRHAGLHGHRDF